MSPWNQLTSSLRQKHKILELQHRLVTTGSKVSVKPNTLTLHPRPRHPLLITRANSLPPCLQSDRAMMRRNPSRAGGLGRIRIGRGRGPARACGVGQRLNWVGQNWVGAGVQHGRARASGRASGQAGERAGRQAGGRSYALAGARAIGWAGGRRRAGGAEIGRAHV
jgi:hypothetical protein